MAPNPAVLEALLLSGAQSVQKQRTATAIPTRSIPVVAGVDKKRKSQNRCATAVLAAKDLNERKYAGPRQ